MDQLVNFIMILVGIYLLYVSHQLTTKHNLKAFYSEKNLQDIPLRNRYDYAAGIGKWLGFIGLALIISALLFYMNDLFKYEILFIAGEVILLGGLIFGFYSIYGVNKKYSEKEK